MAAVTRQQAGREVNEDRLDSAADCAGQTNEFSFEADFGADMLIRTQLKTKKTRQQKHQDALQVFHKKSQDNDDEIGV